MVAASDSLHSATLAEFGLFNSAFHFASIGMALVGSDGQWLRVNQSLCSLLGYPERELLATTFQAVTHREDLETDLDLVRQVLAGEIKTYQLEKRYHHKQGHIVWVLLSVSLVRDADNEPMFFISQIQDITARKQAEEALQKVNAELRAALEEVNQLRGILPICSYCKRIRDGRDYWDQLESYMARRAGAQFSHGVCPDCMHRVTSEWFPDSEPLTNVQLPATGSSR